MANEHQHSNRKRQLNDTEISQNQCGQGGRREGRQGRERRQACNGGDKKPDGAGDQADWPRCREQDAKASGDALAPLEIPARREKDDPARQ